MKDIARQIFKETFLYSLWTVLTYDTSIQGRKERKQKVSFFKINNYENKQFIMKGGLHI